LDQLGDPLGCEENSVRNQARSKLCGVFNKVKAHVWKANIELAQVRDPDGHFAK
jgi:hypothetical protein